MTSEGLAPGEGINSPPPAGSQSYRLTITKITGMLVLSSRKTLTKEGTVEELDSFYKAVLIHNLLVGWWGVPGGVIWTPMSLVRNRRARAKLHQLAAAPSMPRAGWFPDPIGHHGVRYWDGARWTDQVSDVSTDPIPG